MTLSFRFEPIKEFKESDLEEIKKEISLSIPKLENNIQRLIEYLKKEEEHGNYIEIDFPILDSNLSFKIALFYKKLLISVMNHTDSDIFGNLVLEKYDCLDLESLKKLGDWSSHKTRRYKKFLEG